MKKDGGETPKLRMTRQRRALLETVEAHPTHPTADEVYRLVRRRLPHISLGTVYRNLELLAERGLLRKIEFGGGQMRFDGRTDQHYHVQCTKCGRLDDVAITAGSRLERSAERATGYEIQGHRVEFVGLCGQCRTARSRGRKGRASSGTKRAGTKRGCA